MTVLEAMATAFDESMGTMTRLHPENARNGIRAALAEARRHGWQLVPVEPTEEMLAMGRDAEHIVACDDEDTVGVFTIEPEDCYRAMIAAAPSIEEG